MKKGHNRQLIQDHSRRSFLKVMGIGSVSLALGRFDAQSVFGQEKERHMYACPHEINNFDPAGHMDAGRNMARLNFYDGLLRWRDNPPKLNSHLALSYDVSKDLKKWTFNLRKGALFHDGSEVTADHVVYTMERLLELGTGAAGVFGPIIEKGSTRAIDKYTVEFNLKKPNAAFAGNTHFLHVLNKNVLEAHEKDGDWGSKWLANTGSRLGKDGVGTGSYTVEMYDPAIGFDGTKFGDHFLEWDHPHMEKIGLRTVREPASRALGLLKGDFSQEHGFLAYELLERLRKSENCKVVEQPTMRLCFASLHCQKPPTSDVHFRRAICYAFDYESWIKDILHNTVERNIGPIPNPMWGSLDPKKEFGYEYNLDKAREELKKVKLDWKKYLPLSISPDLGSLERKQLSELLQAGLRKIGIEASVEPKSWPTQVGIGRKPETTPHLFVSLRSAYYADPHCWIGEMFDSEKWGATSNWSWYKNPNLDNMLHKAITILDQKEREKLYVEAGHHVVQEALAIFIHNDKWFGPFSARVKGIRFCPIGDANEWRWLYFG